MSRNPGILPGGAARLKGRFPHGPQSDMVANTRWVHGSRFTVQGFRVRGSGVHGSGFSKGTNWCWPVDLTLKTEHLKPIPPKHQTQNTKHLNTQIPNHPNTGIPNHHDTFAHPPHSPLRELAGLARVLRQPADRRELPVPARQGLRHHAHDSDRLDGLVLRARDQAPAAAAGVRLHRRGDRPPRVGARQRRLGAGLQHLLHAPDLRVHLRGALGARPALVGLPAFRPGPGPVPPLDRLRQPRGGRGRVRPAPRVLAPGAGPGEAPDPHPRADRDLAGPGGRHRHQPAGRPLRVRGRRHEPLRLPGQPLRGEPRQPRAASTC